MSQNFHSAPEPQHTLVSQSEYENQNDVAKKLNTPSYEIASPPSEALRTNICDGVSSALKDDDRFRSIITQLDKSY